MGHMQIPELPCASKGSRYTSLDGCPSQPCSEAGLCLLPAVQLLGPARHSGCHCVPRGWERERVWGS